MIAYLIRDMAVRHRARDAWLRCAVLTAVPVQAFVAGASPDAHGRWATPATAAQHSATAVQMSGIDLMHWHGTPIAPGDSTRGPEANFQKSA